MNDELLTVGQAAEYFKVSDGSVHKLIAKKLPVFKAGSRSWHIKKRTSKIF